MLYGMAHIEPSDLIQVDEEKLSPKKTLKLVFDSKPTKIHEFNAEKILTNTLVNGKMLRHIL